MSNNITIDEGHQNNNDFCVECKLYEIYSNSDYNFFAKYLKYKKQLIFEKSNDELKKLKIIFEKKEEVITNFLLLPLLNELQFYVNYGLSDFETCEIHLRTLEGYLFKLLGLKDKKSFLFIIKDVKIAYEYCLDLFEQVGKFSTNGKISPLYNLFINSEFNFVMEEIRIRLLMRSMELPRTSVIEFLKMT